MKMRMKTSRAGKQQANIIQMGNWPSLPRGLMVQPRLSGLVTEKPLGTLSFYTEDQDRNMMGKLTSILWVFDYSKSALMGQMFQIKIKSFDSYLCIRVVYAVIHQDHDEDGNRHPKVSNHPAKLITTRWDRDIWAQVAISFIKQNPTDYCYSCSATVIILCWSNTLTKELKYKQHFKIIKYHS